MTESGGGGGGREGCWRVGKAFVRCHPSLQWSASHLWQLPCSISAFYRMKFYRLSGFENGLKKICTHCTVFFKPKTETMFMSCKVSGQQPALNQFLLVNNSCSLYYEFRVKHLNSMTAERRQALLLLKGLKWNLSDIIYIMTDLCMYFLIGDFHNLTCN